MGSTPMPDEHEALCECSCEYCLGYDATNLADKVQFLVDYIAATQGLTDGGFVFPDGEFWHKRFALGRRPTA
mgnify:CR=1 FL=1